MSFSKNGFTFPFFEIEIPNTDYYWQLQGYMALTGKTKAKLIYTLTDTPKHIIESEAKKYAWSNGYEFEYVIEEFTRKMTYSDIDVKKRIKIYEIERNEVDIAKIYERVLECRKIIENLIK